MKTSFFAFTVLMFFIGGGVLWMKHRNEGNTQITLNDIPVCGGMGIEGISVSESGRYVTALPGWGNYSYLISTKSDSAQFFFDQGLSMYYGYHFKEAVASFKESARFDEDNAMAYWGQALAMGPYYNAAHSYSKPAELSDVLMKMNEKANGASEKEKQLITVMNTRYSEDREDTRRSELNAAYAQALKEIPDADTEAKVLYIDAVMLMHAWDFWHKDGTPKEWTPELVSLCEEVLNANPKHPGALHYYIHLTEASRQPQVALAGAELLKDLMPGIPHMVHMSSHAYERNGLYAKGVQVNNLADSNLVNYSQLAAHLSLNTYSSHYYAVQTYCALTGGMYNDALRYATRCRNSVKPSHAATYDQYLFMLPVLVNVRMGKWEAILRDTVQISDEWIYAGLLSDFAEGIAHVNTGNMDKAVTNLANLQRKMKDPVLLNRRIPFNSPVQMAQIAEKLLEGVILYSQMKYTKAIGSFEEAVRLEDQLIYTEPKDWPIPSRQFLGAYLLKNGQKARAEQVYREDLIKNPGNGWSLLGLSQAVSSEESAKLIEQSRKAFAQAEELPAASVFM